jgi:hypothetical protein
MVEVRKHMDRRMTLGVLATGFASSQVSVRSAFGAKLAQAGAPPSPGSQIVEPASLVSGTYEASYQDGYAPALLEIGFPEDVLLEMFSKPQQRMTISTTAKTLWLQTSGRKPEYQITLNQPLSMEIFGAKIADWLARFDQPTRLLTSFTAPNGRRVQATQSFRPAGLVTVLSIEGMPQYKPIRVWHRVSNEAPKRQKPQLFPL